MLSLIIIGERWGVTYGVRHVGEDEEGGVHKTGECKTCTRRVRDVYETCTRLVRDLYCTRLACSLIIIRSKSPMRQSSEPASAPAVESSDAARSIG